MDLQDILVLIQTIICAISLIVSLITLKTVNKVKQKVEINDNKEINKKQFALGSGNKQMIKN